MNRTAEERLRAIRVLLTDPFAAIPELSPRERQCAALASRGASMRRIMACAAISERTAYRVLDAAAQKVGQALNRRITRDDLVPLLMEWLSEEAG